MATKLFKFAVEYLVGKKHKYQKNRKSYLTHSWFYATLYLHLQNAKIQGRNRKQYRMTNNEHNNRRTEPFEIVNILFDKSHNESVGIK